MFWGQDLYKKVRLLCSQIQRLLQKDNRNLWALVLGKMCERESKEVIFLFKCFLYDPRHIILVRLGVTYCKKHNTSLEAQIPLSL